MTFGELDEEVEINGVKLPSKNKIPVIMVPDLKSFSLKPYVTYRAEDIFEPAMQSKDYFETFYAPAIEAEMQNVPLESLPKSNIESKEHGGFFSGIKNYRTKGDKIDS